MTDEIYNVAIIGAGFCGTMVAVHLAAAGLRIALIERNGAPGRGVAYGTPDMAHLLNVRTGGMSAFANRPAHFFDWLKARDAGATFLDFAPRRIYGDYLQEILRQAPGIETLATDILDVEPAVGLYRLHAADGRILTARRVVLALGNFPPGGISAENSRMGNPYDAGLLARLREPGAAFLIGTGLTSLDLLATLAQARKTDLVHVLSRSGLFPQTHAGPARGVTLPAMKNLPPTAGQALGAVRREVRTAQAQGGTWQDVIDALRPLNQAIWQGWPLDEQKRFLRRLRAYWDTHRHRAAPQIAAAREELAAAGRLMTHRGRFISLRCMEDADAVTWQPAAGGAPVTTVVAVAVNCTGPQGDVRALRDPLVRALLYRGLIVPDALLLGIATDTDGQVLKGDGTASRGLYTLGTWRKGALYESVAVPELRVQAAALAQILARNCSSAA